MSRIKTTARRGAVLLLFAVGLATALVGTACSGNAGLSVGGSVHRGSGGNWGPSLSVGVHNTGRRR